MKHRSHLSNNERSARSQLVKLVHDKPFVCGSLVTMKNTCGKPGCKCTRGERHISLCLAVRDGDKRKMIHVPRQWEKSVESWVENYQAINELMEEVSQACLAEFKAGKEEGVPGPYERKSNR